jgi:hypothetical protein
VRATDAGQLTAQTQIRINSCCPVILITPDLGAYVDTTLVAPVVKTLLYFPEYLVLLTVRDRPEIPVRVLSLGRTSHHRALSVQGVPEGNT